MADQERANDAEVERLTKENERLQGALDETHALLGESNDSLVCRKREVERERDEARETISRIRRLGDDMLLEDGLLLNMDAAFRIFQALNNTSEEESDD